MGDPSARHVVIVGGGAIGICTAYYLLAAPAPPARVTLVEARTPGAAAASGFLALDWHGPATTALARLSWRLHADLAAAHAGADAWGYRAVDSVSYAVQAPASNAGTPGTGEDPPRLTRRESFTDAPARPLSTERDQSWLNAEGEMNLLGTMDSTAVVTPHAFVDAILEAACQRGLEVIHGRPVHLVTSSDGRPSSLHVRKRDATTGTELDEVVLSCDNLVVSTGPWTGRVLEAHGLPRLPIGSVAGHSITLRTPPEQTIPPTAVFASIHGANRRPRADAAALPRTTEAPEFFPRSDGTVYVAGEDTDDALPDDPAVMDPVLVADVSQRLVRATRHVSKVLAAGTVLKREVAYRPTVPDGRPVIGKVQEGVFVGVGHGPWGIGLSTGTGKVIAELILDGHASSADIAALSPARFLQAP